MSTQVGKLIYCTRTVPEMEKVLAELQVRIRDAACLGIVAVVDSCKTDQG